MVDSRIAPTKLPSQEGDGLERLGTLLTIGNVWARDRAESAFREAKATPNFDDCFDIVEMQSTKITREIKDYWLVLENIPTAVMLIFCIEKSKSNDTSHNLDRFLYLQGIQRLWTAGLLPLANNGKRRVLGDLQSADHLLVIENIRCIKEWSIAEKEDLIGCYLQFTYDLAKFTFGMIPVAFDPDRLRTERRVVRYELFMNFVQLLSERDALIAKLLYFGAPNIESAISLKIVALDIEKLEIKFGEQAIRFPKHLINDISGYIQPRKDNPMGLVFVNVRGEEVERVHLNQSFARKSSNIPGGFKITPAALLKMV